MNFELETVGTPRLGGLAFSTVIAVLVVLGLSLAGFPASAQSNPSGLGEIAWPEEDRQQFADLADLGASLYGNDTQPAKLGIHPVDSMTLEAVDNTSTRVVIQEQGRPNRTFIQHHEPVEQEGHRTLEVRPGNLKAIVQTPLQSPHQVHDGRSTDVLTLTGKPGDFAVAGNDTQERVRNFAARIGFPIGNVNPDVRAGGFPSLYGGPLCFEASEDRCSERATIMIECPDCRLAGFNGPEGDSNLENRFFVGGGLVLFDDQGRMVAATVDFRYDLNESAVLDPEKARDAAAEGLRDRGYEIDSIPDLEEIRAFALLAPGQVEVQEVRYEWPFGVVREENGTSFDGLATVEQHAATGEIVDIQRTPADAESPPVDRDSLVEVPIGRSLGLVALWAAAVLVARRQRD